MPGNPAPAWQLMQQARNALAARSAGMNKQFITDPKTMNVGTLNTNPAKTSLKASVGPSKGINWGALMGGSKVAPPPPGPTGPDPTSVNPAGQVPGIPGGYGDLFNNILNGALALYNTPNPAQNAILNPNAILKGVAASEINPNQVGQDAGLGYDAQIQQLLQNYGTTQDQNKQNLSDISSWFGQAADTQKAGAADNAKAFAAQLAGQGDAAQAFINALGGGASPAAAGIANASDIASAGLRGEGLANQNFDTNMKSVVGLDKAQQLANEQTAGTNRLQTLLDSIAQTKGTQAGAEAQARDNAQQALFGQRSQLANLKSNVSGNVFNELEGLRQQKLAELSGLSNTALGTALAGPQIQGAELANQNAAATVASRQISNIGIQKQVAALGGAGNANIADAQPGTRQTIQQVLQGRFLNPNGTLKMAPSAIPAMIASELTGVQGWANTPQLRAFAQAIYRDIVTPNRVNAYTKSHGKK